MSPIFSCWITKEAGFAIKMQIFFRQNYGSRIYSWQNYASNFSINF
jgi:hypothetical protein